MASIQSVRYAAASDITIARGVDGLGSTCAGLLLVGVSDDRVVRGVKEKPVESVFDHCAAKIEPPWIPEIVPVSVGQDSGSVRLGHARPTTGAAMIREGHHAKPIQKDH